MPALVEQDGTTALLGLLRNNTLHTGWVGDSRCILSRQGRYVRVSEDHKPDKPNERKGVEARGGQVLRHRNGPHYVVERCAFRICIFPL